MTQPIGASTPRIGTCPHGLPPGACPICSGSGGGGGVRQNNRTSKPGEMTWSQCFAMGILMKQAQARVEAKINSPLYNAMLAEQMQRNINSYIKNVQQTVNMLQNLLPAPLANTLQALNKSVITPLLNTLAKIPQLMQSIQNGLANIRNTIMQAAEKLASFFGELKNFVKKKVSDFLKQTTKKLFKLFSLETVSEDEDEEIKDFFQIFSSMKN